MGCVAGLQVCLSETPRLSSKASPGLISPTIARWNFSFAGLGSSRIESFANQLRALMLIQLFCRASFYCKFGVTCGIYQDSFVKTTFPSSESPIAGGLFSGPAATAPVLKIASVSPFLTGVS